MRKDGEYMEYDVFISYASEDKKDVVHPLVAHLTELGLTVWIDEFELTLGDSLRRSIDRGLSHSRFGVVILSPAFFEKEWPNRELDALVSREDREGKVILPVWHKVSHEGVIQYSPILASKLAVSTSIGIEKVARKILNASERETKGKDVNSVYAKDDILKRLRINLLGAKTYDQLRMINYELEAYLSIYPKSPEAQMMRYKLELALKPDLMPNCKSKCCISKRVGKRSYLLLTFGIIVIAIIVLLVIFVF